MKSFFTLLPQTSENLSGLAGFPPREGSHHPVGVVLQVELPGWRHHIWHHRGDHAHTTGSVELP